MKGYYSILVVSRALLPKLTHHVAAVMMALKVLVHIDHGYEIKIECFKGEETTLMPVAYSGEVSVASEPQLRRLPLLVTIFRTCKFCQQSHERVHQGVHPNGCRW